MAHKPKRPETTVGERMRLARIAAGLTLSEAAAALGLSKQGVGHWEVGRSDPQLEKLTQLATLYRCSLDWLILGKGSLQGAVQMQSNIIPEFPSTILSREDLRAEFLDTVTTLQQAGVQIGRVTIMPAGTIQIESIEMSHREMVGRTVRRRKDGQKTSKPD